MTCNGRAAVSSVARATDMVGTTFSRREAWTSLDRAAGFHECRILAANLIVATDICFAIQRRVVGRRCVGGVDEDLVVSGVGILFRAVWGNVRDRCLVSRAHLARSATA